MKFKPGYKFWMCDHDRLIEKGWELENCEYFHDDFPGNVISEDMVSEFKGKILTVKKESVIENWYHIDEDDYSWTWPVGSFEQDPCEQDPCEQDQCEEGMTPINGWIICKTCGENLRQIIKG